MRHNELLDNPTRHRLLILESLSRCTEQHVSDYTCPVGMMCAGIAQATGLSEPTVWKHLHWLRDHGMVQVLGKRHPEGGNAPSGRKSKVLVLTVKGRTTARENGTERP